MKRNILSYIILSACLFLAACTSNPLKLVKFNGEAQGTYYIVTYYDAEGRFFQQEIELLLDSIDRSVSIWNDSSIISKINRNVPGVEPDSIFTELFLMSKKVYDKTGGAFDPTVGPLVNAWGFGFTNRMQVDQHVIDSLLQFVGFDKVSLHNGKIFKDDPRIQFDFNAIAQGYSVDLIGRLLENKGVANYLIDVGGEVLASGVKPNHESWKVGIEEPVDNAEYGQSLQAVVKLTDKAMATSGNYRKFYKKDGVKYSHTIDPHTGYPVQHSLLSVSVIASDCALADAWATAFMVVGLDQSVEILGADKNLDAYFIYSGNTTGKFKTYYTEGFKGILEKD